MQFIKTTLKATAITICVLFIIGFLIGLAMPTQEESREVLRDAQSQVADDFEQQYQDATVYGTPIDRCVRAGLVAEGWLQAGDSDAYGHWKQVEEEECLGAGVPR